MDLRDLFGKRWACECGRTHEVPTREAVVKEGAIGEVGGLFGRLNLTGPALLIADETTWEVAGSEVARSLEEAGVASRRFLVPGKKPHADDRTAEMVAGAVEPGDAVIVSIGSGTVTDLSKWAAFRHDRLQVAVATAPSMNGYASGIVALTEGGMKTTRAVRPPLAVVADIDVLSAAPIGMIRAGLGDLLSKPVCNADWKLSEILLGEHFCPVPSRLIRDLEEQYLKGAGQLAQRNKGVVATLTSALILSGVSMVIAGSSAPASGGEHLISHFLDMRAKKEGREGDLHGAQVGVATLATARLYERLMKRSAADLDAGALATVWERGEALIPRVRELFGGAGDAVVAEFEKKRRDRAHLEGQARNIRERWEEIRTAVRPMLLPSSRIRAALDLAGAKAHYADLGVAAGQFREALGLAMCIRGRYSVLDLAFAVGELEPWAEDIVTSDQ